MTEPDVAGANERGSVRNPSKVRRRRARRIGLLAGGVLLLAGGTAVADLIGLPSERRASEQRSLCRNRPPPEREGIGCGRRVPYRRREGTVGRLPPADERGRPDLQPLVRGWRLDNTGQWHRRRAFERQLDVPRLTQLRSESGRRGAVDRLRGGRAARAPDGAVGDVVRAHDWDHVRQQQHLREPVRQHWGRQPGQVDLLRPGAQQWRRRPAGPVAEHPYRPGRREPLGGGRLGGQSARARPVGHLAGDDHPSRQRQGPDLRQQAAGAGADQLRRRHAGCRRSDRGSARRVLLSADRYRARWRRERSQLEHRPDPQWGRAGHRVHREQRLGAVGGLVREGSDQQRDQRPDPQQRDGVRGEGH